MRGYAGIVRPDINRETINVKIGLIPVNVGVQSVEQMVGMAQLAESLGYESVWTFEHVIVPVDYESKYPYDKSGKMGAEPETNFVDPLIALAVVAAKTSKVRLATGVNILSQASPVYVGQRGPTPSPDPDAPTARGRGGASGRWPLRRRRSGLARRPS